MSKDPAAGAARGDDLDAESLPAAPRLFRVSATAGSTAVAADRAGRPDADTVTMIGRSAGPARRGGTVGSAMRRSPAAAVSGAAGRARQTGRQTAAGVCHGGRGEPRRRQHRQWHRSPGHRVIVTVIRTPVTQAAARCHGPVGVTVTASHGD